MDHERYFVRPFTDRDYEASSRISRLLNPELPFTAEEERHWVESFRAPHLLEERWVVAERKTGNVVAQAALHHSAFSFHPQRFWTLVEVDPAHRGRGIGRTLAALVESEAATHRAETLWTSVRKDDPRSLEFARRMGFGILRRLWLSKLDLTLAEPPPSPDRAASLEKQGIRFTTLAQEGPERDDVRRRLFDLEIETSKDVPRMGEFTPISFEQFLGILTSPGFMPEAYFLAADRERYVAMTNLTRLEAEPDCLLVGFTGTRRDYRGRGLASELKHRAFEYARQRGVRALRTVNDSLNMAMWGINEKQGFRVVVEWVEHERHLSPAADVPPSPAAR